MCPHLRRNVQLFNDDAPVRVTATTDVCVLLHPSTEGHEEYRRALQASGTKPAPAPFRCMFASGEKWKDCPLPKEA
jgi:hypothetical protein